MKSTSTRHRDGPDEVGHEHERALQHADEQRGRGRRSRRAMRAPSSSTRARRSALADDHLAELGLLARSPARGYPRPALEHQPAGAAHHPAATGHLAGHAPRRAPRPAPARPSALVGWVRIGQPADGRPAGPGRRGCGQRSRVGRVDRRRPARRAGRRRRAEASAWRASTGGHVPARPSPSSSGSSSWRTRLRRWAGSALDGSSTGSSPSSAHRARVSGRRRPSSGWPSGRMPARPSRPAPAQQVEQHGLGLVVGGVAGEHVGRAARRSGRRGPAPRGSDPGATSTRSARNAAPNRGAASSHDVGLGSRARPQPVVDVHGRHLAAGRSGQHEEGQRVGPARHRARDGRAAARERAPTEQRAVNARTARPAGVSPPAAGHDERAGKPTRASQRSGALISARVGRFSGPSQTRSRARVPADRSTAAMKRSPCSYWASLASSPISRRKALASGDAVLAALAQDPAEPLGRRAPDRRRRGPW